MSVPFRPKTPSSAPHTEQVQADPQPVVPTFPVEPQPIEERGSVLASGLSATQPVTQIPPCKKPGLGPDIPVTGDAERCSGEERSDMPDGTCGSTKPWVPNLRCRACREAGVPGGCAACLAWTERARVVGLQQAFREMDAEDAPVIFVFESDEIEGPPQGWEDAVDCGPRICLGCAQEKSECCCKDLGP
jgi:hypothetical protein